MIKLALLAVATAVALVSDASAQTTTTVTTKDYQTCDTNFFAGLLGVLGNPNSALANCLSTATAPFLQQAHLPSNTSTTVVLTPFFSPNPANVTAVAFVGAVQQTGTMNAAWWALYTGIVNTSAPGVTCTTVNPLIAPDFTTDSVNGPCPTNPAFAGVWKATVQGTAYTYGALLANLYSSLPQVFSYVALAPLLSYVPPCLPTSCQTPLVALCQNPASASSATGAQAQTLQLFANMFSSLQAFEATTNTTLSTPLGAQFAANSQGLIPTHVNALFDCTAFGGWGTSLNSTYGGSKGDASSSARVGVLAAAVAVVAAAIAA